MKIAPRFFLLSVALVAATTPLDAQSGIVNASPPPTQSADDEWTSLKNLGRPKTVSIATNDPVGWQKAKDQLVAAYVNDAGKLRDFSTKNPEHPASHEAKRLEAKSLLYAWQVGDNSSANAARRSVLVAEVRKDATLPAVDRSEVAALADNIAVEKTPNLTWSAKLAAYEQVARNLTVEFPNLPDAYEALLHIAKDSGDDRAPALASEVVAMTGAPAWVKNEAKEVSVRYTLLGKSVVELTRNIIAENNPFVEAAGRPLVIYTWSTGHPPSIAQAKEIAAKAPATAAIIGVCLDQQNLAPAKARATAEGLPGKQVYDWLGRRGEIAEALGAIDLGLVYVADAEGILRSVSAHRNLAATLAALPAK